MAAPFVLPRLLVLPVLVGLAAATLQAQELPKKDNPGDIDFEPKLLLNDLPDAPLPASDSPASRATASSLDVASIEADLEKARSTAARRERLYRAGVLSKVEAEQAALKIVRITRDLENARLQTLTREVEEKRKQAEKDESLKAKVSEAETALAAATNAAHAASTKWDDAQRAAAELRVQRERKLLALGAGSRSLVKRAEAALQALAPLP